MKLSETVKAFHVREDSAGSLWIIEGVLAAMTAPPLTLENRMAIAATRHWCKPWAKKQVSAKFEAANFEICLYETINTIILSA